MTRTAWYLLPVAIALACTRGLRHEAKGGVDPVSVAVLRESLLRLNRDTAPWKIRDGTKDGTDVIVEWKIVEPQWSNIFVKADVQKVFKIYLMLGEHTVWSFDQECAISWRTGMAMPAELVVSETLGKSQMSSREYDASAFGKPVAFVETTRSGEVYEYRFITAEMKQPTIEAITALGWSTEEAPTKFSVVPRLWPIR